MDTYSKSCGSCPQQFVCLSHLSLHETFVQVYYCSLQGVDFFSVDAESLRDFSTNSDLGVLNTRMALGKKESLSDGIGFDCLVGTRK